MCDLPVGISELCVGYRPSTPFLDYVGTMQPRPFLLINAIATGSLPTTSTLESNPPPAPSQPAGTHSTPNHPYTQSAEITPKTASGQAGASAVAKRRPKALPGWLKALRWLGIRVYIGIVLGLYWDYFGAHIGDILGLLLGLYWVNRVRGFCGLGLRVEM